VGIRKSIAVDASLLNSGGIRTGCYFLAREESGGCPMTGQMVSGVEATRAWSAAFAWNVGRPAPTRLPWPGRDRELSKRKHREELSTVAGRGRRTGS
jgi:hypothetical protein